MSDDVFGGLCAASLTGHQVAQPQRNRKTNDVAQRARRDRSTYMRHPRVLTALGLGAAALGLGCASPRTPTDAATRDGGADVAPTCSADCAGKGQVCSLGRCTSAACATAEISSQNIAGCLFYSLQADNVTADDGAETAFLVTNFGVDPANVEIDGAQPTSGGAAWGAIGRRQIAVGASASLPITAREVTAAGLTRQAALRISSDRPVTVAEIESDDLQTVATSSGGTMILPLQALDIGYQAVTYPQHATPDVASTDGSRGGAGRVIIVGTHDGTSVTFTPRTPIPIFSWGTPPWSKTPATLPWPSGIIKKHTIWTKNLPRRSYGLDSYTAGRATSQKQ